MESEERTIAQYRDIIDMPHHVSRKYPQMDTYKRAAQFAPFAALTGFEDTINETEKAWIKQVEEEVKHEDAYEGYC